MVSNCVLLGNKLLSENGGIMEIFSQESHLTFLSMNLVDVQSLGNQTQHLHRMEREMNIPQRGNNVNLFIKFTHRAAYLFQCIVS